MSETVAARRSRGTQTEGRGTDQLWCAPTPLVRLPNLTSMLPSVVRRGQLPNMVGPAFEAGLAKLKSAAEAEPSPAAEAAGAAPVPAG